MGGGGCPRALFMAHTTSFPEEVRRRRMVSPRHAAPANPTVPAATGEESQGAVLF